jgi:hypothetical protein
MEMSDVLVRVAAGTRAGMRALGLGALLCGCGLIGGPDADLARWAGPCPPVTGPLDAERNVTLQASRVVEAAFPPVDPGLPPRAQSYYDDAKRLMRVELDVNRDQRPDRWEYFDGGPGPRRIEIDTDFDGVVDRWVELDAVGRAVSSRIDADKDGTPDSTRVPDPEQDASMAAPPPVSAGGSCASDPACQVYLDQLRADVLARWRPGAPDERVRLELFVSESGCPYDARVLEAASRGSATAALEALSASRPLQPMPAELADLRTEKIVLTFARPSTDP